MKDADSRVKPITALGAGAPLASWSNDNKLDVMLHQEPKQFGEIRFRPWLNAWTATVLRLRAIVVPENRIAI